MVDDGGPVMRETLTMMDRVSLVISWRRRTDIFQLMLLHGTFYLLKVILVV